MPDSLSVGDVKEISKKTLTTDIPIGQVIVCVQHNNPHNCEECALKNIHNEICYEDKCCAQNRADGKNVYFLAE